MSLSVTFRLKSSNYVKTINISGSVVPCREVQEAIANALNAPIEEIHIYLAGSNALLHPEEDIGAYSVIDVVREVSTSRPTYRPKNVSNNNNMKDVLPSAKAIKTSSSSESSLTLAPHQHVNKHSTSTFSLNSKHYNNPIVTNNANVANSSTTSYPSNEMSEEERLAQIQANVGLDTGIEEVNNRFRYRGRGRGFGVCNNNNNNNNIANMQQVGNRFTQPWDVNNSANFKPPPKNYICHNCGKGGHYIQHCPSSRGFNKGMRVMSLPTGIPESMLVECTLDDPAPKFITRDHRIVKRRIDTESFSSVPSLQLQSNVTPSFHTIHSHSASTASTSAVPYSLSQSQELNNHLNINHGSVRATSQTSRNENANNVETCDNNNDETTKNVKESSNDSKYKCIIDHVIAQEAMKTPCCHELMCKRCYDKLVEQALSGNNNNNKNNNYQLINDSFSSTDELHCPNCNKVLILDAVEPAWKEREQIAQLHNKYKRTRE